MSYTHTTYTATRGHTVLTDSAEGHGHSSHGRISGALLNGQGGARVNLNVSDLGLLLKVKGSHAVPNESGAVKHVKALFEHDQKLHWVCVCSC